MPAALCFASPALVDLDSVAAKRARVEQPPAAMRIGQPGQADIRQGAAVEQNEVFGPVLSVIRFETDEEALSIANGTRYGLGAYLHTSDLDRAHDFAERLQAGYVNVNGFAMMAPMSPFGGYKQSGFGRVGGWAGMEEYLQTKNVFIARRQLKA